MHVARTRMDRTSGRLGRLMLPSEGGWSPFRGSGEIQPRHGLTRHPGRLGRLGRLFLTLTCARARLGVWGHIGEVVVEAGFSHKARNQPPQPPQPPFFTCKALIWLDYPSSLFGLSTSLFSISILPNLPSGKEGVQPIGLRRSEATKSSERAMS